MEWVALSARVVVAATLCAAGLMKMAAGRGAFADSVRAYDLVPARLAAPLAATLPAFEVALGALLLVGALTRPAAAAACLLLLAFAGAMAANLQRGRSNDCGCFGRRKRIAWSLVRRNFSLAAVALVLVLTGPGAVALDATILGGGR